MSFKSAIEKVKQMFTSVEELMQKHEEYLYKATNGVVELRIPIKGKVQPCLCVSLIPGYDIDHVAEIYGKVGIKMHKYILRQGNRRRNILYITTSDYSKLDAKRHKFFTRTTSNRTLPKLNYNTKRTR